MIFIFPLILALAVRKIVALRCLTGTLDGHFWQIFLIITFQILSCMEPPTPTSKRDSSLTYIWPHRFVWLQFISFVYNTQTYMLVSTFNNVHEYLYKTFTLLQHPVLDEPITEAVFIVADTDKW